MSKLTTNKYMRTTMAAFVNAFDEAFQVDEDDDGAFLADADALNKIYHLVSANKELIALVTGIPLSHTDYTFDWKSSDNTQQAKVRHLHSVCNLVVLRSTGRA